MITGHKKIYDRMKAKAAEGGMHHAQLFIGPEHVGKTKMALELAVILQGAEENAVLRKHILEGLDMDTLLFLDEGERLPISDIRKVVQRAGQTHHRPYLVIVIENLGRMRPEAVNALLKVLEEPPEGTVFFLTAHKDEDVLPTIRSRCNVTYFQTVSDELLKAATEGNVYADQMVMFAMGRPGKLKSLMSDSDFFQEHQNIHQDLNRFLENPSHHAAFSIMRNYEKHEQLDEMLDILLHRTRTFALAGEAPPVLAHLDFTEILDSIEMAKQDLKSNVNKKLLLENLFLPFAP